MLFALFKFLAEESIHHIINQPTLPLFHYRIIATIYPSQINKMSMPVRTFHGPNPLILDVDLSTYNTSDGTGQSPDNQLRQPDARLLEDLTTAFNNEGWGFIIFGKLSHRFCFSLSDRIHLGKVVKFVGGPPIGYSEWIFYVPHSFISGHIYGHPSGQYFELMGQFVIHVVAIIRDDLANCTCRVCTTAAAAAQTAAASSAPSDTSGHSDPSGPAAPAAPSAPSA